MTSADELNRLLRRFRRLRREEERVLARLVRILGGLPAPSDAPGDAGNDALSDAASDARNDAQTDTPSYTPDAPPSACPTEKAGLPEAGPPEIGRVEPTPIDVASVEPASIEPAPIEPELLDTAPLPAASKTPVDPSWTKGSLSPFLLVVGEGALVAALPWGAVRRVSLPEEERPPLRSLRRWLANGAQLGAANGSNGSNGSNGANGSIGSGTANGQSALDSGYSVRWGVGADDGLICETVRGIFPAGKAEAHGVTVVLLPSPHGGVESVSLEVWVERLFPVNASPPRTGVNGANHAHPLLEVTQSAPPPTASPEPPPPLPANLPATSPAAPPVVSPEALICVRSLPARVALARALRLAGWRVTEETDDEAGLLLWRNGSAVRAYVELPSSPDASRSIESWAATGGDLVLVSARGAPWEGQLPGALRSAARIVHPFAPADLESCVLPPGASAASSPDTPTVKALPLPADR